MLVKEKKNHLAYIRRASSLWRHLMRFQFSTIHCINGQGNKRIRIRDEDTVAIGGNEDADQSLQAGGVVGAAIVCE